MISGSDEVLMREYQAGSEEAFTQLYEKYSSLTYAFIRRRIRSSEQDDLYQKVWRQLHEKKHLYKGQPFAPWFFVLIKNLIIDEYRFLGRKNINDIRDDLLEKIYGEREPPDVEELLSQLPPETSDLVRKYYLEGVGYEALEKEMGMSQTNLRQRLSRAIRSLRKLYGE